MSLSITWFWCQLLTEFTNCSDVCIVEFEQADAGWNILSLKGRIRKPLLSLLVCSELKSVIKKKNKQTRCIYKDSIKVYRGALRT